MTNQDRIKELELQLKVKEGIIETLQEIISKQLDTIVQLRNRVDELTPGTIA